MSKVCIKANHSHMSSPKQPEIHFQNDNFDFESEWVFSKVSAPDLGPAALEKIQETKFWTLVAPFLPIADFESSKIFLHLHYIYIFSVFRTSPPCLLKGAVQLSLSQGKLSHSSFSYLNPPFFVLKKEIWFYLLIKCK